MTSYDTTFVPKATQIVSTWLQGINDFLWKGRNPSAVTSTGTGGAYIITLPASSLYSSALTGDTFTWAVHTANTGPATITIVGATSVGPYPLVKRGTLPLDAGDLVVGQGITTSFDGTRFQIMGGLKDRDYKNVLDFGADATGVADSSAAFTAAGSAQSYNKVEVPPGTYKLTTVPTPTQNPTFVVEGGVTLTGTGSTATHGQTTIKYNNPSPIVIENQRVATNVTGEVPGLKVGVTRTGAEAGWATQPVANNSVALYSYISSSTNRTNIKPMNSVIDVPSGYPATSVVFAGNSNINTADSPDPRNTNQALGVDMVSGGTYAPSAAYTTYSTTTANRWKHGAWFDSVGGQAGSTLIKANANVSVDYGVDLSSATINKIGVLVGSNTPSGGIAAMAAAQPSATHTALYLQRVTDTGVTAGIAESNAYGYYMYCGDATSVGTKALMSVSVYDGSIQSVGNISCSGILQSSAFRATGAAPTAAAGQLSYGATHQTTVGAAGAASALPGVPRGYIQINVEGTNCVIPYWIAA